MPDGEHDSDSAHATARKIRTASSKIQTVMLGNQRGGEKMEHTDRDRTARQRHEDGGTTVDMSIRNPMTQPTVRATVAPAVASTIHRSATEEHVRTRGKWLLTTGVIIGVFTVSMAIVWDLGFGHEMPAAYVLPLYAIALGATCIGCMEHLSRPAREMQDQMINQVAQVETNLSYLVELMDEQLQQQYWRGVATTLKTEMTGTDDGRPTNRGPRGDVVQFRGRNSSSN